MIPVVCERAVPMTTAEAVDERVKQTNSKPRIFLFREYKA
jgi:hypothetical protein